MEDFNDFIGEAKLIDLPLHGGRFTWYKPNEQCKSRLDRMMINCEWEVEWPASFHIGIQRSVSDHCPLILETKSVDWGAKPFRFINAWLTHPDFKSFVENAWKGYNVSGWGGYVLKKKFKLLK